MSADGRRVLEEERTYDRRFTSRPFVAADPEQLAERGFVETPTFGTWRYYAPDADVLLSDAFLDTHCFRLQRTERNDEQLIGLAFEPIPGRRVPEVKGVLWLDQSTARLRSIEFGYVNLHSEVRGQYGGGKVILAELPNGTWIVREWEIRMPSFVVEQDSRGRPTPHGRDGLRKRRSRRPARDHRHGRHSRDSGAAWTLTRLSRQELAGISSGPQVTSLPAGVTP